MKAYRHRLRNIVALTVTIMLLGLISPTAANALTVSNCTGTDMIIQTASGNRSSIPLSTVQAAPGTVKNLDTPAPHIGVKLFEKGLVETLRVSIPALEGKQSYSAVRLSSGQWQLVVGKAC